MVSFTHVQALPVLQKSQTKLLQLYYDMNETALKELGAMKKFSDFEMRYRELIFTFFHKAFLARTEETRPSITTTLF